MKLLIPILLLVTASPSASAVTIDSKKYFAYAEGKGIRSRNLFLLSKDSCHASEWAEFWKDAAYVGEGLVRNACWIKSKKEPSIVSLCFVYKRDNGSLRVSRDCYYVAPSKFH